jgi:UPF0176 protein
MRNRVTDYSMPCVKGLSPEEFHTQLIKLKEKDDGSTLLLDVRNDYESKIGHFKGAVCPPIRKFSSLKKYVEHHPDLFSGKKQLLTYCTGGIRCEKAAAWLMDEIGVPVSMLDGGIHNYLEWINEKPMENCFVGANYVFDGRIALGGEVNGACEKCSVSGSLYGKCSRCPIHVLTCGDCFGIALCHKCINK